MRCLAHARHSHDTVATRHSRHTTHSPSSGAICDCITRVNGAHVFGPCRPRDPRLRMGLEMRQSSPNLIAQLSGRRRRPIFQTVYRAWQQRCPTIALLLHSYKAHYERSLLYGHSRQSRDCTRWLRGLQATANPSRQREALLAGVRSESYLHHYRRLSQPCVGRRNAPAPSIRSTTKSSSLAAVCSTVIVPFNAPSGLT